MLLFRGADKAIRNFNGHTPYEQAMISSNTDIANLIKNFHDQDVVPIREYPKRNQRRRSFSRARSHQRCSSMGRLNDISRNKNIQNALAEFDTLTTFEQDHCNTLKGNCTNKNNTWMTSSISGFQLNSMMLDSMEFNENKDNLQAIQAQSNQLAQTRSAYNINRLANGVNHRYHNPDDIVHTNHSATMRPSHGRRAGRSSTPAACHSTSESFKMNPLTDRHSTYRPSLDPAWMSQANENNSDTASIFSVSSSMRTPSTNSVKTTSAILQLLLANRDSIADLDTTNLPRMIALQRGTNGFGFVVRGKRGISENFTPSLECPASQYLEKIEPNSAASRAGLKAGDFILEVNGINVTTMSHEAVVALIRGSSDILGLKVITVNIEEVASTPKLQHQPNNGNRFCESSDNLYNLRTRKYNCELNYPNDCCQASEINWSINVDNNCKTICRDSFLNAQNGISSQLNKSANESFMNGFVSTDKLNYIRQNSDLSDRNKYCHPSSSNTSLVTHNTVVPPPVSSKPMLAARNGLQNGTNLGERQKQNSQTNLNNKFRLCEKEGVSSNMVQKTVAVSHPLPLILPAFSSSISNSIPPPPPPPPLFTTATKNTSASKPEVPAGILKKSSPAMNELAEDSTTSKKPTEFQNQDGWSEQLTLPPPPPPDEFELSTSETEVQEPSVKYNCTNFQEKCKTQSTSRNSKISSFEENLRKAVAQRRRMIEMASEDDEQDFESLHGKSFQSMLYTESSVKSSKQQSDILPPNQNSFKMAAEKFHLKAIARNIPSNGTIPPPEKFKDCDNAFSKVDNNTGVNTSISLETTKKPVIPQWQSCLIKNNAQCLTNNEKSKLSSNNSKTPELYASIKPFQNNGISGSNDNICSNKLPKDVTTFKQNTAAQSIKCFGRPLTQGSSTATPPPPPPPPPPPLLFEDTPKAMWSARKNDSVKSLVR
ncbi:unnamed protein product [Heterobilharzia americana]|nr:unnamed protein product [Heterobilharzia americana]